MRTDDPATVSDADLADAVRGGDTEAFAVLWDRHAAAGRSAARRLTSTYDPDDLVQEAYLRVLRALQSGAGPTGAFRPYLYTTLRSVAAAWSHRPHAVPVDELPEVVDPRDHTTEVLERSVTARAFRRLPERWQSVLWYTEVEGMEPREAAPLLGLSANTTAALAYRAREGLRREWLQAHVNSDAAEPECRWTVERLGEHARGTLPRAARDRVEEHLTGCLSCSILAEEVDDVASRLRLVLLPLVLGVPAALGAAGPAVLGAAGPTALGPAVVDGAGTTPAAAGTAATGAARPSVPAASMARRAWSWSGPGAVVGAAAVVVVAVVVGVSALTRAGDAAEPVATVTDSGAHAAAPVPSEPAPVGGDAAPSGAADATAPPASAVPPPTAQDGVVEAPPGREDTRTPGAGVSRSRAETTRPMATGPQPPTTAPSPTTPPAEPAPTPTPTPTPTDPTPPVDPPEEPGPVAPEPPVVETAPAAGTVTVFPVLRGTGEPGAQVRATDATGAVVGAAAVGDDGAWTLVATGLGATGTHVLEVVQRVDGVDSEPAAAVGPYVFDLPRVLSPGAGEVVPGTPQSLPWEDPRYAVDVELDGTPGLLVEAFVDGRSTGNLHTLGAEPLVRQVRGLDPGEHMFGVRVVTPDGDDRAYGPTVTVRFTVEGR